MNYIRQGKAITNIEYTLYLSARMTACKRRRNQEKSGERCGKLIRHKLTFLDVGQGDSCVVEVTFSDTISVSCSALKLAVVA